MNSTQLKWNLRKPVYLVCVCLLKLICNADSIEYKILLNSTQ
jgi:hypothetical protein